MRSLALLRASRDLAIGEAMRHELLGADDRAAEVWATVESLTLEIERLDSAQADQLGGVS